MPHFECEWEGLNGKMCGRLPFPWCCEMKCGWCNPFGIVHHLSGDLHCGCIGRRHAIIGSNPWSEIYRDEVARAMEMPIGYLGRRNAMPGRLEDKEVI